MHRRCRCGGVPVVLPVTVEIPLVNRYAAVGIARRSLESDGLTLFDLVARGDRGCDGRRIVVLRDGYETIDTRALHNLCLAVGPCDLYLVHRIGCSQSELHRDGILVAVRAHAPLQLADLAGSTGNDLYPCTDALMVVVGPHELDVKPVVGVPAVPVQAHLVFLHLAGTPVPFAAAANEVQVAVVVIITPAAAVCIVDPQVKTLRHIGKGAVAVVPEQVGVGIVQIVYLGNVNVQVAVVVVIPHGHPAPELVTLVYYLIPDGFEWNPGGRPDIREVPRCRSVVTVYLGVVAHVTPDVVGHARPAGGTHILVNQIGIPQVQVAVIVQIPPGRSDCMAVGWTPCSIAVCVLCGCIVIHVRIIHTGHTGHFGHIGERPIVIVPPQVVRTEPVITHVNVQPTVVVVISPVHASTIGQLPGGVQSRIHRAIRESAVAVVNVEYVRVEYGVSSVVILSVHHIEIDISVPVVITPSRGSGRIRIGQISRRDRNVREIIIRSTIVAPEPVSGGVEIQISVVIVIAPDPVPAPADPERACDIREVPSGGAVVPPQPGTQEKVLVSVIVEITPGKMVRIYSCEVGFHAHV